MDGVGKGEERMGYPDYDYAHEAIELMKKADAGDAQAQYTFGSYLLREVDGSYRKDLSDEEVQRGMRYLKAAAAQGHFHGIAADALGMIYYKGELVPVDYEKAKMWFNTSYMKGIPTGMYMLGECAYYGYGEDVDYEKAAKHYFKAVGYINSIIRLGDMYLNGEYLPYDPIFAKELYEYVLWTEEDMHSKNGFYSVAYGEVRNRLDSFEYNKPISTEDDVSENENQLEIRNKLTAYIEKMKSRREQTNGQSV